MKYFKRFSIIFKNSELFSYYIKMFHEFYIFFCMVMNNFWQNNLFRKVDLKGQSYSNYFDRKFAVALWFTFAEWLTGKTIKIKWSKITFRCETVQLHSCIETTSKNKLQGFNLNYVKVKLKKNHGRQPDSRWKLHTWTLHVSTSCSVQSFFFWSFHHIQSFKKLWKLL